MKINLKAFSVLVLICIISLLLHITFKESIDKKDDDLRDAPGSEFSPEIQDEYNLLRDPYTGSLPTGIRELELSQAKNILLKQQLSVPFANQSTKYFFKGPSNFGGRTRALAFDVSDPTGNTILAGGATGALFKTIDAGNSWNRISPLNQFYSITALAQDTRPGFQNTWYYGGGEFINYTSGSEAGSLYAGDGVYKSTNNGVTWNKLPNSNTGSLFATDSRADFIYRIVVNPTNGDIYVACVGQIMRSQDGGNTWTVVIGTPTGTSTTNDVTDIAITNTGKLYVAFSGTTGSGLDGVWTSVSGDVSSWTHLVGTGAFITAPGWKTYNNYGRIVLAIAPSNQNLVFALYYNNSTDCASASAESDLFRWDGINDTWTNLSASLPHAAGCDYHLDHFSVQQGYDMAITVKPDDPNFILIGGTSLYRSLNGGNSWERIGGYNGNTAYFSNTHEDFHDLKFSPLHNNLLLTADDGGIQVTNDISQSPMFWTSLNNGYNTFQFYHVAIKPEQNSDIYIGGTQDNGTVSGDMSTVMTQVGSGDGVSVGLGKTMAGDYQIYYGMQNGGMLRESALNPGNYASLTPSATSSIFVTYFHLDPDNTENLFYACQIGGYDKVLRITNASQSTAADWQTFSFNFDGYVRTMTTTRGGYTPASKMYLGTDNGRIYRLTDPANTSLNSIPAEITPPGMGGTATTVIGMAVNPYNDNELLAVYSNYGIINIWHTSDAGDSNPIWSNIEGNLSLPSVRSCMILIDSTTTEYYVGTSVGLYKTNLLAGSSTLWSQEGASEIGNALVVSLQLRPSDNNFAIGTHGYGMWKGVANPTAGLPVIYTFTGSGNWNDASNWSNGLIPPANTIPGSEIIIDNTVGGECILNIPYKVSNGTIFTMLPGKKLLLPTNLTIN